MKIERTDDELLDYWIVNLPEGPMFVTKLDAERIKDSVTTNTITVCDDDGYRQDCFICPFYIEVVDLFGAEKSVRLDQVGTIEHIDEDIRALSKRQDKLLDGDRPAWE